MPSTHPWGWLATNMTGPGARDVGNLALRGLDLDAHDPQGLLKERLAIRHAHRYEFADLAQEARFCRDEFDRLDQPLLNRVGERRGLGQAPSVIGRLAQRGAIPLPGAETSP